MMGDEITQRIEGDRHDRTGWPAGPWDDEPDKIEWRSAGVPRLACLIVRGGSGALCGYVAVPPGHPWHGRDYAEIGADVHGGLTYASPCAGHICHVPRAGESDDVFWVGFDCAHAGDVRPRHLMVDRWLGFPPVPSDVYRDVAYVRAEVERLAEQARAVCK